MSSVIALCAALALIFAAAGLMLWRRAQTRVSRERAARFVASRVAAAGLGVATGAAGPVGASVPGGVAPRAAGVAGAAGTAGAMGTTAGAGGTQAEPGGWQARAATFVDHLLSRAGITDVRTPALLIGIVTLAACLWAGHKGGLAAAIAVLIAAGVLVAFVLSLRIQRRSAKLVAQLPSFLDGIVRLVVLGNSVPAAFQSALQTTEAPLRECLDDVSRMLRAGVEIDRAMHHVAQIYHANELELVGAVLRLSVRYGGRADVMLERMATFMRDLEQAQRELVSMSAETRFSAMVLAALPVAIAGFLVVFNPRYFASMWNDETGRHLFVGALLLQCLGAYFLYRLTRLRAA